MSDEKARRSMSNWLGERFEFTHHITLATNSPRLNINKTRHLLREWDARINRKMYGPKWHSHYDELLYWFGFLEKPDDNPHWHLLVRLNYLDPAEFERRERQLDEATESIWNELIPAGTAIVKKITARHEYVADYVSKELDFPLQYEHFITPDEFRRFV